MISIKVFLQERTLRNNICKFSSLFLINLSLCKNEKIVLLNKLCQLLCIRTPDSLILDLTCCYTKEVPLDINVTLKYINQFITTP
jgi:hypothetical protein